jgi:predicted lipid-binding transport protein (Tim44 family)
MIHLRGNAGPALVLVLVLVLGAGILASGCARRPKPRAEVPVAEAGTRPPSETSTTRHAPAPAPTPAPAPAPPPKPASEPPAKNGAPVSDVKAGSSTTMPAVVPQLSAADQERLERETKAALEQAQKAFGVVDSTKLDVEQGRKYLIAKDFLAQAGAARGRKEYERAQALALKARLLAEEIAPKN